MLNKKSIHPFTLKDDGKTFLLGNEIIPELFKPPKNSNLYIHI